MFEDRSDAGDRLASAMSERGIDVDIVLAIPRGGLPVGRTVADALGVPLDLIAAKKLGAPGNPELAVGAATADGSVWYNEDLIDHLDVSETDLEKARRSAVETARQKAETYREGRELPELAGRAVAIVDDGVATGATMRACIRAVRTAGAASVVVGIPVGPRETVAALESLADSVVVVDRPRVFRAVGAQYASFDQVTDEEAMSYLGSGG